MDQVDIDPITLETILDEQNRGPLTIKARDQLHAEIQSAADEADLERLAALSALDFDRQKKAAAKKMGISVPTLKNEVLKRRQDARAAVVGVESLHPKRR